ncbi:MAG: hypothetical protein AAF988_05610 [Pseudomonadota bacterium]
MFSNQKSHKDRFEDAVYQNPTVKTEQKDMERVFTRLFSTEDGQKVLNYLQILAFQRAYGPNASDTLLRYSEGQRSLVATILRMIERGRQ